MRPRYKALFVDLDDTLFDSTSLYDQAIYMAWEHFRKFYDVTFEDFKGTFLSIRNELKDRYQFKTISHHRAILFGRLLERYNISFDADLILELYETYWFAVNIHIQPFPGVRETLNLCKQKEMKILAISDGTLLSRLTKLRSLKISHLIDLLVSSEEVGDTKPKSPPFRLAMEKSKLQKKDVIYVGNSFHSDIVGGELFGIKTVWFNPSNKAVPKDATVEPDYTITDFKELIPILFE